jgi:hypothetical protein
LIKAIADERRTKYVALHTRGVYPDNLEEYNAAVEPTQRLSRVVGFFDEISTACDQDRGRYGELAHLAFQAATEVRKFGINLIFSGQSITADLIGPMRDQLSTRVCFRVARKEISRIAVFRSGAELIDQAGRALTPNGLWQAYYLDKQRLIELAHSPSTTLLSADIAVESVPEAGLSEPGLVRDLTNSDLRLAGQCVAENGGRFTEEWLRAIGLSQRAARRIRSEWIINGWLETDEAAFGKPSVLTVQIRAHLQNAGSEAAGTAVHDSARQAHD